jgi:endonuclease YncB( thermonuclease family)
MFHVLHRVYVLSWILCSVGLVAWLYPRTGISEPLLDWYAVWQNGPVAATKPVAELSGTAVRVIDGASFTLQTADRELYTIGLLGVTPPPVTPTSSANDLNLAQKSRDFLGALVLSNQVRVTATWLDPQRRGVGIVYVGGTNVNAAAVKSGLAKLKRDYIKALPWRDQYTLLRAERRAAKPE